MKVTQNPIRILFVDDNAGSLSNLHELLSSSDIKNFSLECVTTYIGALGSFSRKEHDVCIIDSPAGNVPLLMGGLRRLDCSFPVVVLTSDSAAEVLAVMHIGAADCLLRGSLTPALLERTLCQVIERQRKVENQRVHEQRYLTPVEHANEITLRASEERFRAFVKQSSEGVWCFELPERCPVALQASQQIEIFYQAAYLAACNARTS